MNTKTQQQKILNRKRRHARIRSRVVGTAEKPRLAFFKSNKEVYAQLIDDGASKTIVGLSSLKSKEKTSTAKAKELGEAIAKSAKEKKISQVVFDRGGFRYIGVVKEFADAARTGGLQF